MQTTQKPKVLQQLRIAIRSLNYALATEKTYVYWVYSFIIFNNKRHPKSMGSKEVSDFLSYLAVSKNVAPATQNQALCALVFFYKHVIKIPLDDNICGDYKVTV
jgi:site-specific recombinase XerD